MRAKANQWSTRPNLATIVADWYVKNPNAQPTAAELGEIIKRPPAYVLLMMRRLAREGFLQRRITYVLTEENHDRLDHHAGSGTEP